ncbi:unnamed protein product [Brassica rapa]|uniref:Pentatricopeptide repeat-containing protein n=1 Tax=Brassica campestris TaxID=3711 RepID=A0A3P5YIZ1_BRACM|nr:unnamed protein product [Brassica rapa]VDC67139.1 unnamed protein product [Brassica rapa]
MASVGIKKDVVTYNALLGGYGKQRNYFEVKNVFAEMKRERVTPNLLTYSMLIDVYSKGGLYKETMEIFKEFKGAGLRADVVLYSALIDALCKNVLVGSAVSLIDEMTKEGISPNVVTYYSIIDAFGRSATVEYLAESGDGGGGSSSLLPSSSLSKLAETEDNQLEIKPNVVTFSAILNACSRCNSFADASVLLEKLRVFDSQVYGVVHVVLIPKHITIVMEYAVGGGLFDRICSAGRFKEDETKAAAAMAIKIQRQNEEIWPR